MSKFILSGFADEIDSSLDVQIDVLGQLGIGYIEPRNVDGKNITTYTPEEAEGIAKRLEAGGIAVSAVGSPMGKIKITDDFAPHLADFKRTIEIAKALKAGYIRMFSFVIAEGEDYGQYEKEVFSRLEQFVKANQGSGVTLLHENEKHIYGDMADRCLKIVETFKGEMFTTFDPSNFVQCGQDTIEAFEMLKPYIRYMHLKDSVKSGQKAQFDKGFDTVTDSHRPIGLGDGNFKYIFTQLHKMGYEGFTSLEPHLSRVTRYDGNGAYKFAIAANYARKLFAEVYAEAL